MRRSAKLSGLGVCHFIDVSSKRRTFGRMERWKCWEQFSSLYWFLCSWGLSLPGHTAGVGDTIQAVAWDWSF